MSRKTFSEKVKEKAVQLMLDGELSQKQIAQKFGCSVPSLQQWRKALQNIEAEQEEWSEEEYVEESDEVETVQKSIPSPAPKKGTADELVRQFWNKSFRAVDMLLTPKDVSSDEVVKLVNEALNYAYDHSQK
jgi:transposase-like protein